MPASQVVCVPSDSVHVPSERVRISSGRDPAPSGHAGVGRACRRTVLAAALAGILQPSLLTRLSIGDDRVAVDLHLVLAVDVSGSVNEERFQLQKSGYAAAFRDARLLRAIQSGPARSIAVTMVQWTGPNLQVVVLPWVLAKDEASIASIADRIDAAVRQLHGGGTSISGVIDYAAELFQRTPFQGGRRVIDVSGDGANNRGRPAEEARDDAIRSGIVINGLPILEVEPDLEEFYRRNVIGGPNSFVIPVTHFEEFGDAILKKLILEIAAPAELRQRFGARQPNSKME